MRQYAGFGTPEATNERFKFLLAQGQTGLSVAFDLPTQIGLDSDDERAAGEVGQVGVAIDSLADMETMFDGIPLDRVSTSMTINAPAPILVAMYVAVAEKQGVAAREVSGTAQNDVLKEYVARGTYIYPPQPSLRLAADLIACCARDAPRFNAISLSGLPHARGRLDGRPGDRLRVRQRDRLHRGGHASGASTSTTFAPRISWIFNTHNNFFEEIAKYRALRRMWARIMKERFGATDPRSMMLRTHTQTGGSTLTAQQPENNIVRAAIQALAAALGGVQSMALSCYDEALAIPTEKAQRIAVRTQQIIAEEIGVTDTVDPMAGSYYVEWLTDELERRAARRSTRSRRWAAPSRRSSPATTTRRSSTRPTSGSRTSTPGERVVVGVNKYRDDDEPEPEYFRVDQSLADAQREKLERLRAERDSAAAEAALARLRAAAEGNENMMPAIIEAVHAYCTLGEICGAMRGVFGEYKALAAI